MAKTRVTFVCRSCGASHPRWMGKCPDCSEWDSLEEVRSAGRGAEQDPHRGAAGGDAADGSAAVSINAVAAGDGGGGVARIPTGIGELDRVLGGALAAPGQKTSGGGMVAGSAVMLGGDPGIGKSTLLLQAAIALARSGRKVLYVTSEESAGQLRMRAQRLADEGELPDALFVLADTNLARVVEQARRLSPELLVIDSIQMIYKGDLPAAPGTVTQLRACCLELVYHAKATGTALVLVGHVTKQGALAGPRLLEHMVDTVLYFEGDRYHAHRVVRAVKNRFGSTLEVGLFEMTGVGLREVADGAGLLAAEYSPQSGSVVCPVLSGSRCLLVEVQALTAAGFLGSTKRKVSGLDRSRLDVLIAVLEKRGGLKLADQDVFASSVGGMKVGEPAADLAVALAIAGAHYNRALEPGTCVFGEIGLGGEVRQVQQIERRIIEASRLGFTRVIGPDVEPDKSTMRAAGKVKLVRVKTLDAALEQLS